MGKLAQQLKENSVPSPTDDPGGSSDGRGAKVKGRPRLARRSIFKWRHWFHRVSVLLLFPNETTTGPDFVPDSSLVPRPQRVLTNKMYQAITFL